MKRLIRVTVVVVLFSGCAGKDTGKGSGKQTPFKGRLDAALALKSDPDREEALGKVAVDAAGSKDVDMTSQALQHIKTGATRAQKMGECALILAKNGLTEEATKLAKTIPVEAERDRILKKIATNNLSP